MQKRILLVCGALAAALVGLAVFLFSLLREPVVNGHPLSYWVDQTSIIQPKWDSNKASEDYQRAIAMMDDNCITALTNMLDGKHSLWVWKLNNWTEYAHLGRPFNESRGPDRILAATVVLGRIGPRATNAIPLLEKEAHPSYSVRISGLPNFDVSAAIAALVLIRHDSLDECIRRSLDSSDKYSPDYQGALMILGTNAPQKLGIGPSAKN